MSQGMQGRAPHTDGRASGHGAMWLAWLLLLGTALANGLGATLWPGVMWGAHSWRFAPSWLLGLTAATAILIIFASRFPLSSASRLDRSGWILPLCVATGSGLVSWFARSRSILLGDGLPIVFSDPPGYALLPHEPLSGFLRQSAGLLGSPGSESPLARWSGVAAGSCVAGALFSVVSWYLAGEIARFASHSERSRLRLPMFLLLLAQGYVQLFFGYVENYPYALLAVAVAILVALRTARGAASPWVVLTATMAMVLMHLSLMILAPAFVLLIAVASMNRREATVKVVLAATVLGSVVALLRLFIGYDLPAHLTALAASGAGDSGYLMSRKHISDFVNGQLLLGPLSVLPAVGFGALLIRSKAARGQWFVFAMGGLAAVASWLLKDLSLGYARDWDILAPFAVVFTVMVLTLVSSFVTQPRAQQAVLGLLLASSLIHTVPWVSVNASEKQSIRRFALLPLGGGRTESTIAYWYYQTHERDSAMAWLDRSLAANPLNNRAASLYGEIHFERARPDLAAFAYSVAVRARPDLKLYRRRLAEALTKAGELEGALSVVYELMNMDAADSRSIALLCLIHMERGDPSLAGLVVDRAMNRFPQDESLERVAGMLRRTAPQDSVMLWRYATER